MSDFKPGDRILFQNEVYQVVGPDGPGALSVLRSGSRTPISIPENQAQKIFQEGRSEYNTSKKLNG